MLQPAQSDPLTISFHEGSRLSGFSEKTLRRRADAGILETRKIDRRRMIVFKSLRKLLGVETEAVSA
jgi:hypothetical protein